MKKMKRKHAMLIFSLLFLSALIGIVNAGGGAFIIEPSKEVTQDVECPSGCQSIGGNVSVIGGNIDFYITDPSGTAVLHYEVVSSADFNVSTPRNGTYIIHLANRLSADNVTATLFYGRNHVLVLYGGVHVNFDTIAMPQTVFVLPISNPWVGPLSQIGIIIFTAVVGPLLVSLIRDAILRKYQKYKDGESKTPVVLGYQRLVAADAGDRTQA